MGAWTSYRLRLQRKRPHLRARRKSRELSVIQDRTDQIKPDDVLVFSTFRNEDVRLLYFFKYYRDLGVDHFIMVDNNSDDGGDEYVARQPDASIWRANGSYRRARFGVDWLNWFNANMRMAIGRLSSILMNSSSTHSATRAQSAP